MKKFIKVFSISVLSLFALLIVTITIVLYLVFTPQRLTPIARKQIDKFITCRSEIGEVELTFFSTFPEFGVKIRKFALINPVRDSQFDTLIKADELVGTVDVVAWWKKNDFILTGLKLSEGSVNIWSDTTGKSNYDIFVSDTSSTPAGKSESKSGTIDLRDVVLDNVSLHYIDLSSKLNTVIRDLSAKISGTINNDKIQGNISLKRSVISFEYAGEKYLQQASVACDVPFDYIPSRQVVYMKDARISFNDLELLLNGSVENDTAGRKITTAVNYQFSSWPVEKMLALVPPSFSSYAKEIRAVGLLSSNGSINGFMTDSVMPLFDIHLQLTKGDLDYSGLPLHLHDIGGDITLHTDLKTDSTSFVKILQLNVNTPRSVFKTEGLVNHLFSDIKFDIISEAALALDEFKTLIPDSMKLNIKGKAAGKVRSSFTMTQLKKMQLEKMKFSGSLDFTDFNVEYDSLSLKTNRSKIIFSFPNNKAKTKNTKFASASIATGDLTAGKLNSYSANLHNANIDFETSDVRDTTRIPDLICSFSIDSLLADMDTLRIAVADPRGNIAISPEPGRPDQPGIVLSYISGGLQTIFGQSSFTTDSISFSTDLHNDKSQKQLLLQWLPRGVVDMHNGMLRLAGFSHPVEIPSLMMNFNPETFNVRESLMKIDQSDFRLSGNLNNIASYIRGDSILRGKFDFTSEKTDILQLLTLTNGIGYKDSTGSEKSKVQDSDTTYSGPYMVPRGMDLVLNANIKNATFGVDSASNIKGSVQVHDGILVLEGLAFDTPAARMQLTALYRTPRKNHLFLGMDYHMLDVEISDLLRMIPDIDTLMPMLRSFSGKGEFHIAVETYMDSLYNIKKSTLRGASSIKGIDLVLMDGKQFSEIAKTLRFNKKTQNKVDSLSAEFTIFRNEIDVYPFLIVMDKYKAVIAGRHNLDMTFDYHISVVDSPLPIKLGIDIKGNEDKLSYRLAKCRYAEFYRPSSRHVVENQKLELMKLIRETAIHKVKE